jgi:hypothetical protein
VVTKLDARRAAGLCARVLLSLFISAVSAAAATINVPAGGDLQAALDSAQAGDLILLASGATYTGTYRLPVKSGSTYITVRTDASPDALPAPNTRVTPQHAAVLAKIKAPNGASAALTTAEGAHHWRIELVEFVGNGGADLIVLGASASQTQLAQMPHDLVFDRVYVHGDPALGQKRGIAMNSGTTQVLNSHFSDIKAVGIETQAIACWNGSGPFLIENNYVEAAGVNILFGGSDPSVANLVPSDITVRRNYVTKQLSWREEKWTVKNLFELKNARRVLVEGNVFENTWVASQTGFAILFTTRNQGGKAPWSIVEDVTFRSNVVRHAGGAFSISGYDDERPSEQTRRLLIANNLVYDIDARYASGNGRFVQIGNQPRDIVVEKNTVLQTGSAIHAYGKPIEGFVFRDNMLRHNTYGVIGDSNATGNASLHAYFPGVRFDRNVLAGGKASSYPSENYFPTVQEYEASFMNLADENFALVPDTSLRSSASDGGPLGADVATIDSTMRGSGATAPATAPSPSPADSNVVSLGTLDGTSPPPRTT